MAVPRDAVPAGTPLADRAPTGTRSPGGPSRWRRFKSTITGPSVLFSLIWQVFLIYPVLAVVYSGASTAPTVLGLVSIAAFSVIYLAAFASPAVTEGYPLHLRGRQGGADWPDTAPNESAQLGLGYLATLVVCAFGTFPAAGLNGPMNFLPFLACFVAAAWPLRRSVPTAIALIITGTVAALVANTVGMLIPAFLVIPVVLSMLGTRISVGISDREGHYRRALGVVEERERVARDLHDVLGHTLTALTIRAQLARAQLDSDPDAARSELENIEELTRTALSEMRQTVSGMRVADPGQELIGMTESLQTTGIEVVVVGTPSLIPHEHSALVAWTLREAGTNIARHSGAEHVTVEFSRDRVRIIDDGTGIDTRDAHRDTSGETVPGQRLQGRGPRGQRLRGQGLQGLAERADDAGARLVVRDLGEATAERATGTVVDLEWAG